MNDMKVLVVMLLNFVMVIKVFDIFGLNNDFVLLFFIWIVVEILY